MGDSEDADLHIGDAQDDAGTMKNDLTMIEILNIYSVGTPPPTY
jgi:hypothetical protein